MSKRILISCGTGGVGKTTLSAALAIRAASLGQRVVVITIDPAKRLATSLGVETLGNTPTDLTERVRAAWPDQAPGSHPFHPDGQLWAIMPDIRETFEEFVRELAPDPATAQRVMSNSIFQIFSREFSGANEYMALERLYSLNKDERFDLIVLDTPPARNTVDFLEAPELLARFFEERLIKWLVLPANQIIAAGMKKALGVLERLTGRGFMTSLVEFAQALTQVQARFVTNLSRISDLLRAPNVGFVLVASPAPDLAREAQRFAQLLRTRHFRLHGLLINRSFKHFTPTPSASAAPHAAESVILALQKREVGAVHELERNAVPILTTIPELSRDIHSVEDLCHVALRLADCDDRLG